MSWKNTKMWAAINRLIRHSCVCATQLSITQPSIFWIRIFNSYYLQTEVIQHWVRSFDLILIIPQYWCSRHAVCTVGAVSAAGPSQNETWWATRGLARVASGVARIPIRPTTSLMFLPHFCILEEKSPLVLGWFVARQLTESAMYYRGGSGSTQEFTPAETAAQHNNHHSFPPVFTWNKPRRLNSITLYISVQKESGKKAQVTLNY